MPDKLPLLKRGLKLLVEQLGENDRVAIVVYAGASGLVLPSTSCLSKAEIIVGPRQLQAGGSTNGGAGIQLAYDVGRPELHQGRHQPRDPRPPTATSTSASPTGRLVTADRGEGQERRLPQRARLRQGQHQGWPRSRSSPTRGTATTPTSTRSREARKVLVEQMGGTLVTIAKDVKIQVEFNPAQVARVPPDRLREPRHGHEDFTNDKKDAGEIGAGHTSRPSTRSPRPGPREAGRPLPLMTVDLRYKKPNEDASQPAGVPGGSTRAPTSAMPPTTSSSPPRSPGSGCCSATRPTRARLTYAGVWRLPSPSCPGPLRLPQGVRRADSQSEGPGAAGSHSEERERFAVLLRMWPEEANWSPSSALRAPSPRRGEGDSFRL